MPSCYSVEFLQLVRTITADTLLVLIRDAVKPGCHAIARAGYLFLDDGTGGLEVIATELLTLDGLWPLWKD